MNIPVSRPELELCSVKLYSTGVRGKVYTNHFYTKLNHNFGIEIVLKNNTYIKFFLKMGGCLYNSRGDVVCNWRRNFDIAPYNQREYDFYMNERDFIKLLPGRYKIQFWVNNKKILSKSFEVSYQ